ncbi:hypothetical protein SDC9_163843 [bioreactor metagenome]|uniref:Uncharacterized protein n=1 Tax=bioreactor metagenome TaxID=1076179 RepID=A0A645FSU1_9ZZZZ
MRLEVGDGHFGLVGQPGRLGQFEGGVLPGAVGVVDNDRRGDGLQIGDVVLGRVGAGRGDDDQVGILGDDGLQVDAAGRPQGLDAVLGGYVGPLGEELAVGCRTRGDHRGIEGEQAAGQGDRGRDDTFRLCGDLGGRAVGIFEGQRKACRTRLLGRGAGTGAGIFGGRTTAGGQCQCGGRYQC